MAAEVPDTRELMQTHGGLLCRETSNSHGILSHEIRAIRNIPLLTTTAVLSDSENNSEKLALNTWDGLFFWAVDTEALLPCLWRNIIALDDNDLSYYGTSGSRRSCNVDWVMKGMSASASDVPV